MASPGQTRPLAWGLTLLAGLYRLLPPALRPANFAPLGALGLYGGARLPVWQAVVLPFLVMAVTDVALFYLGNYRFQTRPWVSSMYVGLAGYVLLGRLLLRDSESPVRLGLVSLLGSAQFFLITNAACWPGNPNYAQDGAGLAACLAAGLPFLHYTVLSDLAFTAAMFGAHALLSRRAFPAERAAGVAR